MIMSNQKKFNLPQKRAHQNTRTEKMAYYTIIVDTEETEKNYFQSLKEDFQKKQGNKIQIKLLKSRTIDLIEKCKEAISNNANYSIGCIVLDRDEVKDFDNIIKRGLDDGLRVLYSNPCFEVWLNAYFGKMPKDISSKKCYESFKTEYERQTKIKYRKDDVDVRKHLIKYGDEEKAIQIAQQRDEEYDYTNTPCSDRLGNSTVYNLLKEFREL